MTNIEQKALALVNEVLSEWGVTKNAVEIPKNSDAFARALLRAIEQHEAFRQEVSDAVERWQDSAENDDFELNDLAEQDLLKFIITEPDPLVAVLHEVDTGPEWDSPEDYCNKIRASLDALGFEIREKSK